MLGWSDKAIIPSGKVPRAIGHLSGGAGMRTVLCWWPVACGTIGTRCVDAAGL